MIYLEFLFQTAKYLLKIYYLEGKNHTSLNTS